MEDSLAVVGGESGAGGRTPPRFRSDEGDQDLKFSFHVPKPRSVVTTGGIRCSLGQGYGDCRIRKRRLWLWVRMDWYHKSRGEGSGLA